MSLTGLCQAVDDLIT